MDTAARTEIRPWDDWEDDGGFDDEDALMGTNAQGRPVAFQERPWYYEKKQNSDLRTIPFGIQMSFL